MESTVRAQKVAKRPGGRTADVTRRVHQAITELLLQGGVGACTFSAVAERAGIERSTLYRRFPNRWDAIIDAWMARAAEEVMPSLQGDFAKDLRSVLEKLAALLASPMGPALLTVAAELRAKSGGDYSREFFDRRMDQLAPMFEAAIERGQLPADVDREALFTFAAGPIYFRMFIAGRTVDKAFIGNLVDSVCARFCLPRLAKAEAPA
ncbi:MAG TPA: TetR/AcrR family transcriptional regulator [Sphingomicrobium sp.]|nr:TetR/AcrR family transcriptional regulator [Sphingomicrobium sp.]